MAGISIEVDTRTLDDALRIIGGAGTGRALARAINLTVTSVRAKVLRELSAQIGLTQRKLAGRVRTQRVRVGAAGRVVGGREGIVGRSVRLTGSVSASGADITAQAFGARQIRRGVSFSPGRKAKRRRIPGAFIQEMPGGRTGVFIRATESPNVLVSEAEGVRREKRLPVRRGQTDIPIAKLLLPGVSRALFDDAVQETIRREGEETLGKRLKEAIEFELLKIAKKGR